LRTLLKRKLNILLSKNAPLLQCSIEKMHLIEKPPEWAREESLVKLR